MEKKVSLLTFSVGVVLAFVAGVYLNTLLGPELQGGSPDSDTPPSNISREGSSQDTASQDESEENPATTSLDSHQDESSSSSDLSPSDLEIKEGVFEGLLEGTIIEIEELDQSRTKYTLDVKGERSFENGDSFEIVGEFIVGPETKCVSYKKGSDQDSSIDCSEISQGDHVLVYPEEDITLVAGDQPLNLVKIMKD